MNYFLIQGYGEINVSKDTFMEMCDATHLSLLFIHNVILKNNWKMSNIQQKTEKRS